MLGDKFIKYFESFEEDFFRPYRLTERQELHVKREVAIHAAILQTFVVNDPSVPVSRLNTLQLTMSTRAREGTRGRAKQYRASRHNMTFRRQLRNWLLNKYLSECLDVFFDEPMPTEPALEPSDLHYIPVEVIEMLHRFETWAKYQVPSRGYVIYTREDRRVLSLHFPTEHQEQGAKCLKFEEYVALRKDPETKRKIESILDEYYVALSAKPQAAWPN